MNDIDPQKRQAIMQLIRDRTEKFANLSAKPSTISGRKMLGNQLDMVKTMFNTSPSNWIGVGGMDIAKQGLETEEERQFFTEQLEKQRKSSRGKLEKVLQNLVQFNNNNSIQ